MSQPTISIHIDGDFDFTPEEIWPDGVPDNWTADDVVALVKKDAINARDLVDKWDLDPSVEVTVMRSNPHYGGNQTLIGDPSKPFTSEHRWVWR